MPIPISVLPSFLFYCYVSAVTPGPANICSLSTSIAEGRRAAFEQWTGLFAGFFADAMIAVFATYFLGTALNDKVLYLCFVGAAYLFYLAFHILRENFKNDASAEQGNAEHFGKKNSEQEKDEARGAERKKFAGRFLRGFFVQLTNIKVILMCLTAIASFALPYRQDFFSLFLVGLFLPLTGPVANLLWIFAGLSLERLFSKHKKMVNVVMAAALILCALSLLHSFFANNRAGAS